MIDFDLVAYLTLGLSLSAAAMQIGRWLLNADPRTILAAGRRSLYGLAALAPLVLLWLMLSGRSTLAMMLAAFILPVAVQGAHRWRGLLRRLGPGRIGLAGLFADEPARPRNSDPNPDPELVRRSVAVLQDYLDQGPYLDQGRPRGMSRIEALALLGLEPEAGTAEIRDAHRRLAALVAPERGGTRYLRGRIDEARDALIGDRRVISATFDKGGSDHV